MKHGHTFNIRQSTSSLVGLVALPLMPDRIGRESTTTQRGTWSPLSTTGRVQTLLPGFDPPKGDTGVPFMEHWHTFEKKAAHLPFGWLLALCPSP